MQQVLPVEKAGGPVEESGGVCLHAMKVRGRQRLLLVKVAMQQGDGSNAYFSLSHWQSLGLHTSPSFFAHQATPVWTQSYANHS